MPDTSKKILVTGAHGFIGQNLLAQLRNLGYYRIYSYDVEQTTADLAAFCRDADIVYHLAGINRSPDPDDFSRGNLDLTRELIRHLIRSNNPAPIVFTSSIQAELDNNYGRSKKAAEMALLDFREKHGNPLYIFRLANVFGKWCRPNYNSVVATFCYNVAHDLPLQINDPERQLSLVYIDNVVEAFISVMDPDPQPQPISDTPFYSVDPSGSISLRRLAETIAGFRELRTNLEIPDMSNPLVKQLYSTYLSYLPTTEFRYPLVQHSDERGSFTEVIRSLSGGQVSINVAKPGITKGSHWHHTKNEKFVVLSGKAVIRFRRIGSSDIIRYPVSGTKLEVVDIPVGYTHDITNVGEEDLITLMWCNEPFNPEQPDTWICPVDVCESEE